LTIPWHTQRRHPIHRVDRAFTAKASVIKLRNRIDIILLGGIVAALIFLAISWFVAVQAAQRADLLDPLLVRPLADERILKNVRDDLAAQPLLDAAYHAADGRLYIAQSGGVIHHYDPRTRLWNEETPFRPDAPVSRNFVTLRSGCGNSMFTQDTTDCPDPDSLWAVTELGGLVRHTSSGWRIVIGDTAFLGASGRAVDEQQLTAAAISPDSRWLVLGSGGEGIGIYDTEQGIWRGLPAELFSTLPSLTITHLVYWADRFWIGTPVGMVALQVSESSQQLLAVEAGAGEILDLDAGDALWVLRRQPCTTGGNDCLWIGKYQTPGAAPQVLFDERHRYPSLQLADLSFAQQWENDLVVAGESGIFSYNVDRHDWRQLEEKRVRVTLALPEGDGFYFGFDGGVGLLRRNASPSTFWELPGEQIVQLLVAGREVLALTAQSNAYVLEPAGEVTTLYQVTSTSFDPVRFTAAVAVDDRVLFTGPDGVLIHDVVRRHYSDLLANSLPAWLLDRETQLVAAGEYIYAVNLPARGSAAIYRLLGSRLVDPASIGDETRKAQPVDLPSPVTSLWPWGNDGIGLVAGDGSVYQVTPTAVNRLTGKAEAEMDLLPWLDVILHGEELVTTSRRGLRRYHLENRQWDSFVDPPADTRAEELAVYRGALLMRTDAGRLVRQSHNDPLLIGDDSGFGMNDATLSDAIQEEQRIYLAGNGKVNAYDLSKRRIVQRWDPPTSDALTIKAIVNQTPLTLGAGTAYLGANAIDPGAGTVIDLSTGNGRIWTVRQDGSDRYLKSYSDSSPSSGNARCFFRTAAASGVASVMDARLLPNGLIAAATDGGLHFYHLAARTWYSGPSNVIPKGGRLYVAGDYLVVVSTQARDLHIVPLHSIRSPDSCSTSAISFQAESYSVSAVTVDEGGGRVAWLNRDGSVVAWHNGSSAEILAGSGGGPAPTALRRIFDRTTDLLVTTGAGIWRYNLKMRSWHPVSLHTGPNTISDINIESSGNQQVVTVQGADGSLYTGEFSLAAGTLSLQKVGGTDSQRFTHVGANLLDIQNRGDGVWTFVLTDRLKYYDPAQRVWRQDGLLGSPDSTTSYQEALGRGVAVANSGRSWWIATAAGAAPGAFARYDLNVAAIQRALDHNGVVWSLNGNGALERCAAARGEANYTCARHAPDPFWLDPGEVRRTLVWRDLHIFEFTSSLRIYDPTRSSEVPLPAGAEIQSVQEVRHIADRLWFWNGGTLVILRQSGSNRNATLRAERIEALQRFVVDANVTPWILTGNSWQVWQNDRFISPTLRDGRTVTEGELTLFVAEGTIPTAIDSNGVGYSWQGGRFQPDDLLLPVDLTDQPISGLWQAPNRNWWVKIGSDQVAHVERSQCFPQAPAPETEPLTNAGVITESSTITDTANAAATPTPAPVPTPTPTPAPCLLVKERVTGANLPALAQIASSTVSDQRLALLALDGTHVTIDLTRPSDERISVLSGQQVTRASIQPDQWPTLRQHTKQLANGRHAYDPVIELQILSSGALMAIRPLSREQLASQATLQLQQPAALDTGWLQWDRPRRQFQVATPNGVQSYSPQQFIQNGELLFEPVQSLLAERADRLHVANQYGVWIYGQSDLRLDDNTILFRPVDLQLPITAAHGRFQAANGDLMLGAGQVQAAQQDLTLSFGDVRLTERLRGGGVTGSYQLGNTRPSVFGQSGFRWDEGQAGLAYANGQLYLLSTAGIHRADTYTGFDPGPHGIELNAAQLFSEAAASLYLRTGENLYRRDSAGWQANVVDPTLDRMLVDRSAWQWRLDQGNFQVSLGGQRYDFAYDTFANGVGFTSDRLQSAAWYGGQLYAMTAAFLEVGTENALSTLGAGRHSPARTSRLDPVRTGGTEFLYRTDNGSISRWDGRTGSFVAVLAADDLYQQRGLVETSRLRLALAHRRIVKEVRLDDLNGGSSWAEFAFVAGHFPFDVVTSLAANTQGLYVGTVAGLMIYTSLEPLDLNGAAAFYDLRGNLAGTPVALTSVGVPVNAPDLLMARSASACIQRQGSGRFTVCADPSLLDERLRVDTPFWRWTTGARGAVSGLYRDERGRETDMPAEISRGRFPHDRLRQGLICGGEFHGLWLDDWQTIQPGRSLSLSGRITPYDLRKVDPERLICVSQTVVLSDQPVQAGVYLQQERSRFLHWAQAQWQPVADQKLVQSLRHYADHPPVFERPRLRLEKPAAPNPFVFTQRDLDDHWRELEWQDGQLLIDRWQALVWSDNRLWAATGAGLVPFMLQSKAASLNPHDLLIVREPLIENEPCPVTDLASLQSAVLLRCNAASDQVYEGQLQSTSDRGGFRRIEGDPFAESDLITSEATGYWHWRRVERLGGGRGRLEATFRGEAIQLAGGRFPFDMPNSLALHLPGQVEMVATTGGWYRAPYATLSVKELGRPETQGIAADAITRVGRTRDGDGFWLCLRTSASTYIRLSTQGDRVETPTCPAYLGQDSLWRYAWDEDHLQIGALQSVGGAGARRLVAGQFGDDIVTGPPVTGRDGATVYYLLPTRAGVLRLDRALSKTLIHMPPFQGLPQGRTPSAVLMLADYQMPIYAGIGHFRHLDEGRNQVASLRTWEAAQPPTAAGHAPLGQVTLTWHNQADHQWLQLLPEGARGSVTNALAVDVSRLDAYYAGRAAGYGLPAWLWLGVDAGQLQVDAGRAEQRYRYSISEESPLVATVLLRDQLLLIHQRELLEVSLDEAVEGFYR
jgi:hypothetical protein